VEGGEVTRASVYFRDLNAGRWVGAKENEQFRPASLFKLPLLIAYYKSADRDPSVLEAKILLEDSVKTDPAEITSPLVRGKLYTAAELLDAMIIYSDNDALNALLTRVNGDILNNVFDDLGLKEPEGDSAREYTISPSDYSLFLRVLFNGTYLSRERSEAALALLSKATYKKAIVAGVPEDIRVSHKYGEHGIYENNELVGYGLSDCGIVYAESSPFIACVFTEGKDLTLLQKSIASLSALMYDHIKNHYGE
jgi:beta-lactamase class A